MLNKAAVVSVFGLLNKIRTVRKKKCHKYTAVLGEDLVGWGYPAQL